MKKSHILIIEDEASIRDMIRFSLENSNFIITEAEQIAQASNLLLHNHFDLILIDWMLPGKNGVEFVRDLKKHKRYQHIPIIMLTAKAEENNKIVAFESGIDDYVTKPFSPRELIARIHAVLKRSQGNLNAEQIYYESLCLNLSTNEISINNNIIFLTPREYQLLHFLMTHPLRVYSRAQLLNYIWEKNLTVNDRVVDAVVKRLRKTLKKHGCAELIQTVRGMGYRLK